MLYKTEINKNIECIFFSNKNEMVECIYTMIENSTYNTILFKGDIRYSDDLSYKILRKILPLSIYNNGKHKKNCDSKTNLRKVFTETLKKYHKPCNDEIYVVITEKNNKRIK